MRAILGKVDCPDSAYILVLRGIDEKTLEYYGYHLKKYDTPPSILGGVSYFQK